MGRRKSPLRSLEEAYRYTLSVNMQAYLGALSDVAFDVAWTGVVGMGLSAEYRVKTVKRTDKINCFIMAIIIGFAWGFQGVFRSL